MTAIDVDTRNLLKLERALGLVARDALGKASRDTVNAMAFSAMREYKGQIREDFINRNKWTVNSVRVEKATGTNPRTQEARVGSVADYMGVQESGGLKRPSKGADGVSIPTGYSAGQKGQKPRTRLPRAANALRAINLERRQRIKGSRKLKNWVTVRDAAHRGQKFVYLNLGRSKGIFRVLGKGPRARVEMVHSLGRKTVRIAPNPMLEPIAEKYGASMPKLYEKALRFQLKRLGMRTGF